MISIGAWTLPTAYVQHRFLPTTSSFDHVHELQATETSR